MAHRSRLLAGTRRLRLVHNGTAHATMLASVMTAT
jgi:hypothetical protein